MVWEGGKEYLFLTSIAHVLNKKQFILYTTLLMTVLYIVLYELLMKNNNWYLFY